MRRVFLPLLATTALAACSTSPVPLSRAKPAPVERVVSNQFTKPSEGAQEFALVRDSGVYGAALKAVVWVDGVRTAELNTSETVKLYLPKGQHFLSVSRSSEGTGPTLPVTVPSATTQYRISDGQVLLPIE